MQIRNRIYNNTLYVVLSGELDEYSATEVRLTLDELFEKEGFNQVIVISLIMFIFPPLIPRFFLPEKPLYIKGIPTPVPCCNFRNAPQKIFRNFCGFLF